MGGGRPASDGWRRRARPFADLRGLG